MRSEYGGTAACAHEAGRPDRTCFVNQCLCDVDLTRDPTLVTVLNGTVTTDTSWYDPYNPDAWVPPPHFATAGLLDQYFRAVFWAVSASTSVGENIGPRRWGRGGEGRATAQGRCQ